MLKNLAYLILFASFFLPAYAQEGGHSSALPGGDFQALRYMGIQKVARVVDPHTVQLGTGKFVRLAGIDVPDFDPHEPGNLSITAMQVLSDMLVGQDVYVHQTKKKDWGRSNRMGHNIAHIQRKSDEVWVQGTLLSLGLARVRTSQRNPEMALQMYELEEKARGERLGLWAVEDFQILKQSEAKKHIGGFHVVEGKIESASLKSNTLYLNFGLNWKYDFTVAIASADRKRFSKQGLDPLQWNGKTVRARGWIRSYNGPYMEINHPEAIEILALDSNR